MNNENNKNRFKKYLAFVSGVLASIGGCQALHIAEKDSTIDPTSVIAFCILGVGVIALILATIAFKFTLDNDKGLFMIESRNYDNKTQTEEIINTVDKKFESKFKEQRNWLDKRINGKLDFIVKLLGGKK